MKRKKVITYGTFDLFHIGHLNLLTRLRALGNHLTVAVSTDEFNEIKGKKCVVPFSERAAIVAAIRCVDEVILESNWAQKAVDISQLKIDIFGMGDDWIGKFDELSSLCSVVYLPRTDNISTSALKQAAHNRYLDSLSNNIHLS